MNIAVIGSGYVGLVAGACLAESGNRVVCADVDRKKIALLRRNVMPIYEAGLGNLVRLNVCRTGNFTDNLCDLICFCFQ